MKTTLCIAASAIALLLGACGDDYSTEAQEAFAAGRYARAAELFEVALDEDSPRELQLLAILSAARSSQKGRSAAESKLRLLYGQDPALQPRVQRARIEIALLEGQRTGAQSLYERLPSLDAVEAGAAPAIGDGIARCALAELGAAQQALLQVVTPRLDGRAGSPEFITRLLMGAALAFDRPLDGALLGPIAARISEVAPNELREPTQAVRRVAQLWLPRLNEALDEVPALMAAQEVRMDLALMTGDRERIALVGQALASTSEAPLPELVPEWRSARDATAKLFIRFGRFHGAAEAVPPLIDQILEEWPRSSRNRLRPAIGEWYADEERWDDLLSYTEAWLSDEPASMRGAMLQGVALLELGRPSEAEVFLQRASGSLKDDPRLLAAYGRASLASGDFEGAILRLNRAVKGRPRDGLLRIALAEAFLGRDDGDPNGAIRLLRDRLTLLSDRSSPNVREERALLSPKILDLWRTLDRRTGDSLALSRASLEPDDPIVTARAARITVANGQLARAESLVRRALSSTELDFGAERALDVVPEVRLARIALDMAKADEVALRLQELLLGGGLGAPGAKDQMAALTSDLKTRREALVKELEALPDEGAMPLGFPLALARRLHAEVLLDLERPLEAREITVRAVAEEQPSIAVRILHSRAIAEVEGPAQAEAWMASQQVAPKERTERWLEMARLAMLADDIDRGLEHIQAACEGDPSSVKALRRAIDALSFLGRSHSQASRWAEALGRHPDARAGDLDTAAATLTRMGEHATAARLLEAAVQRLPAGAARSPLLERLVLALHESGQPVAALRTLPRLRRIGSEDRAVVLVGYLAALVGARQEAARAAELRGNEQLAAQLLDGTLPLPEASSARERLEAFRSLIKSRRASPKELERGLLDAIEERPYHVDRLVELEEILEWAPAQSGLSELKTGIVEPSLRELRLSVVDVEREDGR